MIFVDDLAIVVETDDSHDNSETLEGVGEYPNGQKRESWRQVLRKQFTYMIKIEVWR